MTTVAVYQDRHRDNENYKQDCFYEPIEDLFE